MKIGIFGAGVVGGGVIEILAGRNDVKISKICVRDAKKPRDFEIPVGCEVVEDAEEVFSDEKIETVVELIGGTGVAWEIVRRALESGKNVVTANKALIAKFLPEIEAILVANPGVKFGFEAAVGGGIPVIHAMQKDFAPDRIRRVAGILNGTTNFILSKMATEGADFSEVLQEAQNLGFAEADPTADVGGFDARAKIAILAKMAFGAGVSEAEISTTGIERVTETDFAYAGLLDSTIKLVAVAERVGERELSIFVSPVVVKNDQNLAKIGGATNAVSILSENLGETILIGEGAGRRPTANAVISDVLAIGRGDDCVAFARTGDFSVAEDFEAEFFVRFRIRDRVGVIRRIGEAAEKFGISIDSILQLPGDSENLPFVLTTDRASDLAVARMCAEISEACFCREEPFFMPILK